MGQTIESQIAYPDCTLEAYDELCIRVKFHFLNNTNQPTTAPNDAYCLELLRIMNQYFNPGKIRLSFDYNCVHRVDLTITLTSHSQISTLISENHEEMEFEENSVNLYFIQQPVESRFFGSLVNKHAVLPYLSSMDPSYTLLLHEVGHTLGLVHTFAGNGLDLEAAPVSLSGHCKDVEATSGNVILCELFGDGLCDTGIDPLTLDLDEDNIRDGSKWVNLSSCTQSDDLLPSISDGCNDVSTPWNIPINNFMSYYGDCRNEFSPCQFGRIHEVMLTFTDVVMDCEEDPFSLYNACTAEDIFISNITTWQNQRQELCPGQKIIITSTGHLILDNSTLTRKDEEVPGGMCPDLFLERLWDGIHIYGRGSSVLHNGSYLSLGGITLKNESVIEYSKNGIQALRGFGKVDISNSAFRHNLNIMTLRDPWPLTYPSEGPTIAPLDNFTNSTELCGWSLFNPYPKVILRNSSVNIGSDNLSAQPLSKTQILVEGGSTIINNSSITNGNSVTNLSDITAVKSGRGRLDITNGTVIDNFNVAVFKAADIYNNCAPRGLTIRNSSILNSGISIHNRNQFVGVSESLLEGNVISEGLCYSNWVSNTFKNSVHSSHPHGTFTIQSPIESCLWSENLFNSFTLDIYGNNQNSYSLCNTWRGMDDGYAVVGNIFVNLPISWGREDKSSGNKHLDDNDLPGMFSEDAIVNYYYPFEAEENFDYDWLFTGDVANQFADCTYETYPFSTEYDSTFAEVVYNYSTTNTLWDQLNTLLGLKEDSLIYAATFSAQFLYAAEINEIEMKMADLVGKVLSSVDSTHEAIENTWLTRANANIVDISELIALWYGRDFIVLDSILESSNDVDAQVLLEAVHYIAGLEGRDLIMDSLPQAQLDTLVDLATKSFGFFTNIIRDYLSLTYDKVIYWPVETEGLVPRSAESTIHKQSAKRENQFVVYPNPSSDCFQITDRSGIEKRVWVSLNSIHGQALGTRRIEENEELCLYGMERGIYFLQILSQEGIKIETHKVILQ